MTVVTKYAKTITQTTGGKYATFENLNNIKNNTTGSYSESHTRIKGKSGSPNRPSTLTLTNFGFNLPSGALIKNIKVEYRHSKLKYGGKVCNIGAPTIGLVNVSNTASKGVAPTTSLVTSTKTFTISPSVANVNSSSFGVKINYPANTNSYEGYMRISFIRIKIEYVDSAYTLSMKKVSGGYNEEDYTVQVNISNKNLTNYNPSVVITAPVGFTFKSSSGGGTLVKNNVRTFTWNPKLSKSVGTRSINLVFSTDVVYPSGVETYTGTFTAVESYKSTTSNHTATITERAMSGSETITDTTQVIEDYETVNKKDTSILVNAGEEFLFSVEFTNEENDLYNNLDLDYGVEHIVLTLYKYTNGSWMGQGHWIPHMEYDESIPEEVALAEGDKWFINETISIGQAGAYKIYLRYENESNHNLDEDLREFLVYVRPNENTLDTPYVAMIKLSEEETCRLGNGYAYVAQTFMKEITEETYVRDWYKNFRIAVFNNAIPENVTVTESTDDETGEIIETITDITDYDNLTLYDIFSHAEYWSECLTEVNSFESLECSFVYNKNYPLYILVVGDWNDADRFLSDGWSCSDIQFTEPCVVEQSYYTTRESSGIYPIPIENLILNDGSNAELTLPENSKSSDIIFYDFLFDEEYSENDIAIQGLELIADIEQTDNLTVYASLKSPSGGTGERSIVLNDVDSITDNDSQLTIGGYGDLWNFNRSDFKELKDWEMNIAVSNILKDTSSNINFGNVQLVAYVSTITHQDIIIEVEDDDLAMMGVTIEDVNIPEGLETDTNYLAIDGTDINEPISQSIREKIIKLKLRVNGCDLEMTTKNLRQLTKLLLNERDQFLHPIPKRIWFSHHEDVYFEYIIETALKIENQLTGYKVEADLTIPAGTSFSLEDIVTGSVGFVQGFAAVSPIIQLTPTGNTIELLETVSEQKFNIGYNGDWYDKIVEINCEDMKVYLKSIEDDANPIDISGFADINVDWFRLYGEYSFKATNCTLRTVQYTERW